jgi:hypothetical protein
MNILVGVIFVFGFSPVSFKCPHTSSYNFYMKTKLFLSRDYIIMRVPLKRTTGPEDVKLQKW